MVHSPAPRLTVARSGLYPEEANVLTLPAPLAADALLEGSAMKSHRFFSLSLVAALCAGTARPDEPKTLAPDQFDRLHKMIRVQSDEQRFWQIPWKLTITEARLQAAHEGKPIFVWAGAGGAPIGVC